MTPSPDRTETITSTKNPKLVHIKKLLDEKKYRDECGEFIVEGDKFIDELKPDDISYIVVSETRPVKEDLVSISFRTPHEILQKISGTERAQNMIAVVKKPAASLRDMTAGRYIIAEGIQDPGNLGTIIRTIEASGADGLIYTAGTADPFSPKVVRASAGSILRIPVIEVNDTEEIKQALPAMQLIATVMHNGIPFREVRYSPFCGIMLGSEGQGLSEQSLRLADKKVTIPLKGKAESLNVGITAGILLFQT